MVTRLCWVFQLGTVANVRPKMSAEPSWNLKEKMAVGSPVEVQRTSTRHEHGAPFAGDNHRHAIVPGACLCCIRMVFRFLFPVFGVTSTSSSTPEAAISWEKEPQIGKIRTRASLPQERGALGARKLIISCPDWLTSTPEL